MATLALPGVDHRGQVFSGLFSGAVLPGRGGHVGAVKARLAGPVEQRWSVACPVGGVVSNKITTKARIVLDVIVSDWLLSKMKTVAKRWEASATLGGNQRMSSAPVPEMSGAGKDASHPG